MSEDNEYRITDEEWAGGWRHELREAVDLELEGYADGAEAKIEEIWVKKKGRSSVHDYRVVLSPRP
jgi:hypothetical protein